MLGEVPGSGTAPRARSYQEFLTEFGRSGTIPPFNRPGTLPDADNCNISNYFYSTSAWVQNDPELVEGEARKLPADEMVESSLASHPRGEHQIYPRSVLFCP